MMNKILIVNALIWAAVFLLSAYFYNGTENYKYLVGILLVGFTLQNGFTYTALKKNAE